MVQIACYSSRGADDCAVDRNGGRLRDWAGATILVPTGRVRGRAMLAAIAAATRISDMNKETIKDLMERVVPWPEADDAEVEAVFAKYRHA